MTRQKKIAQSIAQYFAKKGKIMTMKEYIAENDTPHRARAVRKITGSWGRLIQLIKVNFPKEYEAATKPVSTPKPAKKAKAKIAKKGK
jgi:hypothetical protein|tara:strand:+ start:204 stop:467 length:264 start_codon:yes stop_codon:yes gene_type:complete